MTRLSTLPRAHPRVIWTSLPDGAVLYSTETEIYYGVNAVGAAIWSLLPPATRTLDELVAELQSRYPDATEEQIRGDVLELLDDLLELGLLEEPRDE